MTTLLQEFEEWLKEWGTYGECDVCIAEALKKLEELKKKHHV